jgi:solute:Na+ symporter, SSS family
MMVIPGIVAGQLFPQEIAQNSDQAYPLLIIHLMPVVIKGLMVTAMLSAAMSSLANVFNSSATIFTIDIWSKFRPNA